MKIDLPYYSEEPDRHGNIRRYVRRHGKRTRIRAEFGTEEFWRLYREAIGQAPRAKNEAPLGSLRWLTIAYMDSAEFKRLGPSTKKGRRGILESICQDHGLKPFALMRPKHVSEVRDEKADLPEAANGRVKALRQLFKWAVRKEYADRNPARECEYIRTGSEGFHTWTGDEVAQFEARWPLGTKQRKALDLLAYTGVRRSDVVRLGKQMERNGGTALAFTEAKGRDGKPKHRVIPILPILRRSLDASPSGHLTYLVTAFGKPYTANGFGNWFRRACIAAGLPHCSAHGLRKWGATSAAENGATEHQLMVLFGWESPKQAALYTRKVNRERMAAEAMGLIVAPNESATKARG